MTPAEALDTFDRLLHGADLHTPTADDLRRLVETGARVEAMEPGLGLFKASDADRPPCAIYREDSEDFFSPEDTMTWINIAEGDTPLAALRSARIGEPEGGKTE